MAGHGCPLAWIQRHRTGVTWRQYGRVHRLLPRDRHRAGGRGGRADRHGGRLPDLQPGYLPRRTAGAGTRGAGCAGDRPRPGGGAMTAGTVEDGVAVVMPAFREEANLTGTV